MKKIQLFLVMLLVSCLTAAAQGLNVTGKVTYADDGSPVIGATIKVKGTHTATLSDVNGFYKITIPANAAEKVLVVTFTGLTPKEVQVSQSGNYDVSMSADAQEIEDVVVTGFTAGRSQRATGYAATVVNSDEINKTRSATLMTGVQGKVPGLQITQSGATGSSSKVVIRGFSSFNGNQPLYVVDGIPINDTFQGSDSFSDGTDYGNQSGDINPADVESMTILKGASATALYGSRAANGVVVITTKRAKDGKMNVTYDGTFMGSEVLRTPQTQNLFGQGWPFWDPAENGSWGPKLDGRMHAWGAWATSDYGDAPAGYKVMQKPFSYVENNIRNFYKTGFEMNHNLTVSAGDKNTGVVFSYGNVTSNGLLPMDADKFERNTISLRGNLKRNRFSLDASVNYVRKDVKQAASGQGADGASVTQDLLQHATDVNLSGVADFNDPNFNPDNYWTFYAENPYWILANNPNYFQEDRLYGKVEVGYEISDGLKAMARVGGDFSNSREKNMRQKYNYLPGSWSEAGGKNTLPGAYTELDRSSGQIDATVLINADYDLGNDWTLTGFIGGNMNQRSNSYLKSYLYGLDVPGWYSLANGTKDPLTTSSLTRRRLIGLLGEANINYKNFLYASVSARNDWSSTLPIDANSFFYWGANASLVISDMVESMKNSKINLLKVRVAYGQTGSDAGVYLTQTSFLPARFGLGYGNVYLPLNGVAGLTENNTMPNNQLRPEITTEIEAGISLKLFDNRLGLDASLYDKTTKDQIINAAMAPETGYTQRTRNVGRIQNQGIELLLTTTPVRVGDWEWDVNVTFTKNWSKVLELWDDVKEYRYAGAFDVDYMAIVGQPLGVFRVPTPLLVAEGEHAGKVVVNSSGMPQIDPNSKATVGTSAADFMMGFNTNLRWKNFSFGATIDWRAGGYFYSNTAQLLSFSGNATPTVYNERQPFLVPNSVKQIKTPDGKLVYRENDIPITWEGTNRYYSNSSNKDQFANWVLPKDYVKLREVSIGYDLPAKWFGKVLSGVKVSLVGRNLLMWTAAANNFVDPDATNYGNDLTSEIGEFSAAPTTRSFGGSIQIRF